MRLRAEVRRWTRCLRRLRRSRSSRSLSDGTHNSGTEDLDDTGISDASLSIVMRESSAREPLAELAPEAHVTQRSDPSRRAGPATHLY